MTCSNCSKYSEEDGEQIAGELISEPLQITLATEFGLIQYPLAKFLQRVSPQLNLPINQIVHLLTNTSHVEIEYVILDFKKNDILWHPKLNKFISLGQDLGIKFDKLWALNPEWSAKYNYKMREDK